MRVLRHPLSKVGRIAVFSGAFHPPTVAHVGLANAARAAGRQVLWTMPRDFPHKRYEHVGLEERLEMVLAASADPVAVVENGLFFDMAGEVAASFEEATIELLMGEDAARRIVEWDYGLNGAEKAEYLQRQFHRFRILVATRERTWQPPAAFAKDLEWLPLDHAFREVSSTEVRARLAAGKSWRPLVPDAVHPLVERWYGG